MNLHLTRDEAAALEADGWVVLFRVAHRFPTEQASHRCAVCGTPPEHHPAPPAEFVEAAKPCETCEGTGNAPSTDWPPTPCAGPDCLDGKRRIAVAVPLASLDRLVVTVGHVVVTWGPLVVVDWHSLQPWQPRVSVQGNGRVLLHRHVDEPTIDVGYPLPPNIDPATLVGQYALGIRKVEP